MNSLICGQCGVEGGSGRGIEGFRLSVDGEIGGISNLERMQVDVTGKQKRDPRRPKEADRETRSVTQVFSPRPVGSLCLGAAMLGGRLEWSIYVRPVSYAMIEVSTSSSRSY